MPRTLLPGLCCFLLLSLGASPGRADDGFLFDPQPTYKSVDVNTALVEFVAPIRTLNPAGDQLFVVFDPYVPSGWTVQFCQLSTGQIYSDDHAIALSSSAADTLRIDFQPVAGVLGKGHVDIRIYRVADPGTWKEATLALGHGLTLPVPSFSYRSDTAFQQTTPWSEVHFFSPIQSFNTFDDSLIVQIQKDVPAGWFAQWCRKSTGICYSELRKKISFNALITDTLRIDFLCYSSPTGIGNVRIKTQSNSNPAIWYALPFRVRMGDIPAAAPGGTDPQGIGVRIVPNPVRSMTDLQLMLPSSSPVHLTLIDLSGRQVMERMAAPVGTGMQRIRWDGRDDAGNPLPSGVYFYRVEGPGTQARGKLTISR